MTSTTSASVNGVLIPTVPNGVAPWAWDAIGAKQVGNTWHIPERNGVGEIIGWAIRRADGSKTFKPGGHRGLTLSWPLPTYAGSSADDPVLIVEGGTDTAAGLGLSLDTIGRPSAAGGGTLLAELLKSRHVCIIAENDQKASVDGKPGGWPGRDGANKIGEKLLNTCESVKIVYPPIGIKDLRQWVLAGADRAAFVSLASKAELISADPSKPDRIAGAPVLLRMSDVVPSNVRWLWRDRLPLGRLSLLVGRPGEGKSFATADWAARITRGRAWPDGAPCPTGSVLMVAGEDDPADTLCPRLQAHDADLNRVVLLSGVQQPDGRGGVREVCFTLENLEPLRRALEKMPDCALVIVDPIGSFVGGRVDAHRDNEVRGVLAPLAALAQRTGAAVLLVAHQRKGAASHADDLVLGSRAFTGIARSVLHLMRDPANEDRRLLLPGKSNLSRPAAGLAFTIDGDPARLVWEDGPVAMTADGVLAAQGGGDGGGRSKRDDAAEWLCEYLADGPKLARDILSESKAAGFNKRTIDRAKSVAGIQTRKESAFGGGWVWALTEGCQPGREGCHSPEVGNLRTKPDENREKLPKVATSGCVATFDGSVGNLRGDTSDSEPDGGGDWGTL